MRLKPIRHAFSQSYTVWQHLKERPSDELIGSLSEGSKFEVFGIARYDIISLTGECVRNETNT